MDREPRSIIDDFQGQLFERFYKFFDMKTEYNKVYLMAFNLNKEQLVTTNWFRQQL